MNTVVKEKETSTLTIESFIDSSEYNGTDPIRIECGVTYDESMFKPYFAQRPLDEKRCIKIAKSMKKYGNFSSVDCLRKGKYLYTWDGQHVLRAAVIAGKPINYNVYNKVPEYILSIKNSNTKSWTLQKTHDLFLKMGDEIALEVQDFIDSTSSLFSKPLRLTAALRLLSGTYSNQAYRDRQYSVTEKNKAHKIVRCLADVAKYVTFATDSKFVSSFQSVYNCGLYDHSVMKKRLPSSYMQLHSQLKVIDIVIGIENCYNYRSRSNHVDFVSACGLKRK
tara:strand:+ start:92 stop:928 length:837 start_codon:yes stop_codon:yes gene_type:complete